jgi:alpha-D-ribose 1-methylphosphonate 5-triphosphate synthase subunit PhnH
VGVAGKIYIAPPRGTMNNPILDGSAITATRTYTLPDVSGTVALQTAALTAGKLVDSDAAGLLQNTYTPVTTVATPGTDTDIPTAKAVRTAITAAAGAIVSLVRAVCNNNEVIVNNNEIIYI